MRFFDQKLSLAILLFIIPLLFLPKINLISIDPSETAGLRIDDFILLSIGILLMWSHAVSNQRLFKIEGWLLLFTAFSFFSFLSNRLLVSFDILHMDAKIFYVIRLPEYFLFFYAGAHAFRHFDGNTVIRAFFLWNLCLMILQKFNLAGGIMAAGYHADVSGRTQGIAAFPSEMGLLINLLFCWLIYDESSQSRFVNFFPSADFRYLLRKLYPYWMFLLFGALVIFTGNRISILTLAVCFLFYIRKEFSFRSAGSLIGLALLIPAVISGIVFMIIHSPEVYERSLDLFSYKNAELFEIVWEKIDLTQAPLGNEVVSSENYDVSWWIRIHKWLFAAKSYLLNPECYLQGLGPGFCGAALDGGLLRVVVECGIVGAILFWKFFSCIAGINRQTKWMVIAFTLNMIFFDAYLAYKTMSFLLFASGYAFVRARTPAITVAAAQSRS